MCLALPGEIIEVLSEDPLTKKGHVRFGSLVKEIHLAFVPEAQVGDYVLVHVGFAMSVLKPEQAHRVFDLLAEANESGVS